MKTFLAIYMGTQEALAKWKQLTEDERARREQQGIQAWMAWGTTHAAAIVDQGTPLGKTKRIAADGISNITNRMTGYVIVKAESHDAAARMFESHPHFAIFPGESVEIMECLPLPEAVTRGS
jgi:hypothetical protein